MPHVLIGEHRLKARELEQQAAVLICQRSHATATQARQLSGSSSARIVVAVEGLQLCCAQSRFSQCGDTILNYILLFTILLFA